MDFAESLYYLIPTFFIFLFLLPIFCEVRVSCNPIFNRAVVALFIFKKKIFYYVISYHGSYIKLENEKGNKVQDLKFTSPEFFLFEEFSRQIKDKIRLKNLTVIYNVGLSDAFETSMFCGVINQIILQVFLRIKNVKPNAHLSLNDTISYNKTSMQFAFLLDVSMSLFDILYSFIKAFVLTKENKKYNI